MAKETYKYIKSDNTPVIVDAAYKDGTGNNIVSQYSTKAELTTKATELQQKIDDISGPEGMLSLYRKAADQDVIDTNIASTAAGNLKIHTDNTTIHIAAAERTAWGNKYDKPSDGIPAGDLTIDTQNKITTAYNHSQEGTGTGKTHHTLTVVPMTEESDPYIIDIDSTALAATYDNTGKAITATYATKTACNAKYTKPENGIPKTDLTASVQASLDKADTALQSHQSLAEYRKSADQDIIDATLQTKADSTLTTTEKTIVGAINELNSGKQAVISDLDDIRSGAALGTTALQIGDKTELATKISSVELKAINHINSTANPHAVTKAQVGLGNVDNTADTDKPISTATQTALDAKQATISDLDDIRSGAALGKTAIQSHQDISGKVDKPTEPVAGQGVNVPYYFDVTYAADKATVHDYTVDLLDNSKAPGVYGLDINTASTSLAGLMSATDKTKLDGLSTVTMQTLTTPSVLTASTAIGSIAQGTVIPAGTSLWTILQQMFEGTSTANYFYCGTMSELPTTDADITSSATMTKIECDTVAKAALMGEGYNKILRPNTEYVVFAIEQACNLTLSELDINSSPNSFATLTNTGTMYLYCVGDDGGSPLKVGDGTVDVEYNFICN